MNNLLLLTINIKNKTTRKYRRESEKLQGLLFDDKDLGTISISDKENDIQITFSGDFSHFFITIYSSEKTFEELEKKIEEKFEKILDECIRMYADSIKKQIKDNYKYGFHCY